MGRVCSVLPGSTVDGMGAHNAHHDVPAAGNGAPSHPVPADPPPEASSVTVGRERVGCSTHVLRAYPLWAGVGAAGAARAEGMSAAPSGAGKPARRSEAQPGA